MQKRSPDTSAGLLRWLMAAQTGLLPTQPITAQINLGLSLWLDEKRGSCVDDLQDARVETTLALGRVQSCVRPFFAAGPLALMKSADRLPDHSNGLEAL